MLTEKIAIAAKKYTERHIPKPEKADYLMIENAMLIGSQLTLHEINESFEEKPIKETDWNDKLFS